MNRIENVVSAIPIVVTSISIYIIIIINVITIVALFFLIRLF